MQENLNKYITDLLHIEDVNKNKLVNLEAGDLTKTLFLYNDEFKSLSEYVLRLINNTLGKPATTILRKSVASEQIIGDYKYFDWHSADNTKDLKKLNDFIASSYKDMSAKGNNPLFLSIGALSWKVPVKDEIVKLLTPVLIFPIRLVRAGVATPIAIEFIQDDIFINPCLVEKLRAILGEELVKNFPHPNGLGYNLDDAVSLESLASGVEYFTILNDYISSCTNNSIQDDVLFSLNKEIIAISGYNHDEVCMYYDIKRNIDKITNHPLVKRIFGTDEQPFLQIEGAKNCLFIDKQDNYQKEMIEKAVAGNSMIIKGPPGTGKTLTIANIIGALLNTNKKVLFASKKIAALSEVQAKLPPALRDFTLLLDFETEAETAKVDSINIKKQLNNLLQKRKNHNFNQEAKTTDLIQVKKRLKESGTIINNYYDMMFKNKEIYGNSLYDALDCYFQYEELPLIPFIDPEVTNHITRENYNALIDAIQNIETDYQQLTHNETINIVDNPWYDIPSDIDKDAAYTSYCDIATHCENIHSILKDSKAFFMMLNLKTIEQLYENLFTEDEIIALTKLKNNENFKKVVPLCNNIIRNEKTRTLEMINIDSSNEETIKQMELLVKSIESFTTLTLSELEKVKSATNILKLVKGQEYASNNIALLGDYLKLYIKTKEEANSHYNEASIVFPTDLTDDAKDEIASAARKLEKYVDKDVQKPGFLDFASKNIWKKLKSYTLESDVPFSKLCHAVCSYHQYLMETECIDKLNFAINSIFNKQLEQNEIVELHNFLLPSEKQGIHVFELIDKFDNEYDKIATISQQFNTTDETVISNIIDNALYYVEGFNAYQQFNEASSLLINLKFSDFFKYCKSIVAIYNLLTNREVMNLPLSDVLEFVSFVSKNDQLKEAITKYKEKVNSFANSFFTNNYIQTSYTKPFINVYDLAQYIKDRSDLAASSSYNQKKNISNQYINITLFCEKFEGHEDSIKKNNISLVTYFEHSMYYYAINSYLNKYQSLKDGIWEKVENAKWNFSESELKIQAQNSEIILNNLMQSIDPSNHIYDFLNHERDLGTLRSLFKNYPEAILSLKKCIIATPSTASILFRPEQYEDFDVLIVDEASQLEPVSLLPVLFRSKQVIIVGDEWQMPPIKHFKLKSDQVLTFEEFSDPDNSALGIALNNKAFETYSLQCHYRSEVESLIKFSQDRFYHYMKTFPSPDPKTEDLGFTDIYIENAKCDNGVNILEAEATVNELRRLFDRYYIDEQLTESIGVVAFGMNQLDAIINLVQKDKKLCAKMNTAKENFKDDIKEKLIFFKTIETVQGQETDHLILSLTYGVTKTGSITHSFGQLNNSKIGQCIFNVAVTRARKSISVIHSIKHEEIKDDSNIKYIKDYLYLADFFSKNGSSQFVHQELECGFVMQVSRYLEKIGIAKERIVYNYGVTDESIKMPLAILDKDCKKAVLGIWCEKNDSSPQYYIDNTIHYFEALAVRWNIYSINILEWFFNQATAKKDLEEVVNKIK